MKFFGSASATAAPKTAISFVWLAGRSRATTSPEARDSISAAVSFRCVAGRAITCEIDVSLALLTIALAARNTVNASKTSARNLMLIEHLSDANVYDHSELLTK